MKTVKITIAKPNGKPPTGDESLGIEPYTHLYEIEDGDKTEEGE